MSDRIAPLLSALHSQLPPRSGDNFVAGAFTYGTPTIRTWGENAVLRIGKFCSIAQNVTVFLGGEHRPDWVTTYPFNALVPALSYIPGHPRTKGDVVIGNDVWLGDGATILSGVRIGDGAVVGARALVTKDVPPYGIVGGNPAKLLRYRFEPEVVSRLLGLRWWDWVLADIEAAVPLLLNDDLAGFLAYGERL